MREKAPTDFMFSIFRDGDPLAIQLFRRRRVVGKLKLISEWKLDFGDAYKAVSRAPEESIGIQPIAHQWLRVPDRAINETPKVTLTLRISVRDTICRGNCRESKLVE